MSPKCIKIIFCLCFLIFSGGLFYFSQELIKKATLPFGHGMRTLRLPFIQCILDDYYNSSRVTTPSLESFIRASTTVEGQELRLSGLAVFSNLTDACQPPVDVSKSKIQVNKIALISLVNETVCQFQDLAVNAQNAGYAVAIYFANSILPSHGKQTQDILLIPVIYASRGRCYWRYSNNRKPMKIDQIDDNDLKSADRTNVEITGEMPDDPQLTKMQWYLARLYVWFLLGPMITLEWLRRTKKLCCMSRSGGPRAEEERATEDGETAVGEAGPNTLAEDTQGSDHYQATEHLEEQTEGEEEPLIIAINDSRTSLMTTDHTRNHRAITDIRRVTTFLAKIFGKFAVGCGYVILIVVALPVGISSGGWSFFRFDEGESNISVQHVFWDAILFGQSAQSARDILVAFLPLWWSPFQIFCFFLYSWFTCKTTWTTATQVSKLIRSDWFASNMYLIVFGVVVPYCFYDLDSILLFVYFTTYNTVCTICNLLFIIILNKHKFVTRYVFYISVCMICAYIESDIVAVFYFMLNSEGSLINLKLTALRTVAIGLTLTLSFSSSMHIIRKLAKPQESLFEGLSEK